METDVNQPAIKADTNLKDVADQNFGRLGGKQPFEGFKLAVLEAEPETKSLNKEHHGCWAGLH